MKKQILKMSTDGSEMVSYLYEQLNSRHQTISNQLDTFDKATAELLEMTENSTKPNKNQEKTA